MLKKLSAKILQLKKAAGIEISFLPNDELAINAIIIKLDGNKIVKESEHHFLKDYGELINKIGDQLPVAVSLTGKGILMKKLALSELTQNPIERILPAANPDGFYLETIQSGNYAYISIARKELVEKIIANLHKEKFKILSVSLGPTDIQLLTGLINFDNCNTVATTNYQVDFTKDGKINEIVNIPFKNKSDIEKKEYSIGDQYVFSQGVICLGSAIRLITDNLASPAATLITTLAGERENYKYSLLFKRGAWALMIAIFSLLSINIFFYNYYFNKNKEMQIASNFSRGTLEKTNLLGDKIKKIENFLRSSGWNSQGKLSFFADRIANEIPDSMLLTSMKIYPVNSNDTYESSALRFKNDTIQLSGTCDDPTLVNWFANDLKEIRIFKEINVKNYLFNKEMQNGIFNIEIIIK